MARLVAINPENVQKAYAIAMTRQGDMTGEINDPSLGFSIGVAVGCVFRTLGKRRSDQTKAHHTAAKDAVWAYHRHRTLPAQLLSQTGVTEVIEEEFDPAVWARHPFDPARDIFYPDNAPFADIPNYVSP